MIKKSLLALSAIVFILLLMVILPTSWQAPGEATRVWQSQQVYKHAVRSFELSDKSRKTAANGSFAGSQERRLKGHVWYPSSVGNAAQKLPLVIYSHGFMSFSKESIYLAEFLASNGYVVVAANYPLSNLFAPGGPVVSDVANQARDVAFLIDQAFDANIFPEFASQLDENRIAAVGLSLGGMTTQLASFHPSLRDPRIALAVNIAGPTQMFTRDFYQHAPDLPMLMVAGDIDAMVHHDLNAVPLPDKHPHATLLTLKAASHTGFAHVAGQALRFLDNADSLGCYMVRSQLDMDSQPFKDVFSGQDGVVFDMDTLRLPCNVWPLPPAMKPGQQHELTKLAIFAYLQMHFARDVQHQSAAADFLFSRFPMENAAVTVHGYQLTE